MVDDGDNGKASSSWKGQRHFIALAALGGTVAATVVVTTISVVLRPAHVEFAVEKATKNITTVGGNNDRAMYLNMTVTTRRTSGQGRAMVKYRTVFVDLVAMARSKDSMQTETYRAELETKLPVDYLEAGAGTPAMSINTSLLLVGNSITDSILGKRVNSTGNIIVVVSAEVIFRIGVVNTRVYNIVVSCPGVKFHLINDTDATPVICTG